MGFALWKKWKPSKPSSNIKTEKDRIRDIVGRIGGRADRRKQQAINAIFLILVVGAFAFELLRFAIGWEMNSLPSVLVVELAVLLVSLKIIWMIHTQSKVDHFQFYVLHSIEFQMSMLARRMNELTKELNSRNSQAPAKSDSKPLP